MTNPTLTRYIITACTPTEELPLEYCNSQWMQYNCSDSNYMKFEMYTSKADAESKLEKATLDLKNIAPGAEAHIKEIELLF